MDNSNEIIELHRTAVADLAFFKNQQWRVTNYAVLVFAAVVAAVQIVESPEVYELICLWLIAGAALVFGLKIVGELDRSISERRDRLAALRLQFSSESMEAWAGKGESYEPFREGRDKATLEWIFRVVLVIGFLVTSWLLWRVR